MQQLQRFNFFFLQLETIIHHNFQNETETEDCHPQRCSKHKVFYDATLQQITALIQRSETCRQFVKVTNL